MPPTTTSSWTDIVRSPQASETNAFPGLGASGPRQALAASEELRARQQDEVEAIRSIYMDLFEEFEEKAGPWRVSDSIEFSVCVRKLTKLASELDELGLSTTSASFLGRRYRRDIVSHSHRHLSCDRASSTSLWDRQSSRVSSIRDSQSN